VPKKPGPPEPRFIGRGGVVVMLAEVVAEAELVVVELVLVDAPDANAG
jgi:hypothetical protein